MKRILQKAEWVALLIMTTSLVLVAPADAVQEGATIDCGTIITEDTVLTADVGPCGASVSEPGHGSGGHGLVIGADGVDRDLNGHHLRLGRFGRPHQASGVLVDGHSDASVFGGTVRGFFHGVQVVNGARNEVSGIRAVTTRPAMGSS